MFPLPSKLNKAVHWQKLQSTNTKINRMTQTQNKYSGVLPITPDVVAQIIIFKTLSLPVRGCYRQGIRVLWARLIVKNFRIQAKGML